MLARVAIVLVLLLPLAAARDVLAQDAASAAAESAPSAGADDEARGLFAAGQVAFREGRFENALDYLERAYALSQRPALLYNIGTTLDRLRRDEEAVRAFEQYLAEVPDADNRTEVEARVAVLRSEIEEGAPDADASSASTTSEGGDSSAALGGWITLGAGLAIAVAGAVLLGVAAADAASVENAAPGTYWSAVRDAYGRAEAESVAGSILVGVGSAAAIAGLVWALVAPGGQPAERASARRSPRVRVSVSAGALLLGGSF